MKNKDIGIIKSIFTKKYISDDEYEKAYKILNENLDNDKIFCQNHLLGLLIRKEKYEEARVLLSKIGPDEYTASTYYSSYLLDVEKGDSTQAYKDILNYAQSIILNGEIPSLGLPISLLEQCEMLKSDPIKYFNTPINMGISDQYNTHHIVDEDLQEIYGKIITSINNRDYEEAKYQIGEATEIIHEKDIPIDLYNITQIIDLVESEIKASSADLLNSEIDCNTRYNILITMYDNNCIDYYSLLQEINTLVEKDPKLGQELLDKVKYDANANKYNLELSVMKNKAREINDINSLSEEERVLYNKIRSKAKALMKVKNYKGAYEEYCKGKELFNLPIFDYYIGRTLYKIGDTSAKYNLISYVRNGGRKTANALLYLDNIAWYDGNDSESNTFREDIERINTLERNGFVYKNYNNDFNKKIEQVLKMYKINKKQADKMLNELKSSASTSSQKQRLNKIEQNKKLLRRK